MKIKLILKNQRKLVDESLDQISENTDNLLLELDDLNARHVMSSIKKVPLKDRPGNDIFGNKWRTIKGFSSEEDLTMKSIHEFLTKKNYTLGAKSMKKDISFIPPGGGERKTKKEIRFDLLYREPARDLPQHVLDKIKTGEIKEPQRREFSIQKALGKFKTELGGKYNKWIKFLQGENFEYFTKSKPGELGTIRPNYRDFLGTGSEQYVIYSRHPIDIVRMSDFKSVKSCHAPGATHFDDAKKEALGKGGAVVLYVQRSLIDKFLKDNKMTIEEYLDLDEIFADPCRKMKYKNLPFPSGRVRLRNAIVTTDPSAITKKWKRGRKPSLEEESVLVPERRRYGQVPPGALGRLQSEVAELQSEKTSHFASLISKKLGGEKEKDAEFYEQIKKKLEDHASLIHRMFTRNLRKFPGLKFPKHVSISQLFWKSGRDTWDPQAHLNTLVSDMFKYFPLEYREKVHDFSKQETSKFEKEEIVRFLSKAFRLASFEKLKLYGKTYHMIPGNLKERFFLAVPKIHHIPEDLRIGDSEISALKKNFMKQIAEHFKETAHRIYEENTDFVETSDIFTDVKLSGAAYGDTDIKTLFNDFLSSSPAISPDEEGKFGHSWKNEFVELRSGVLEEYLKNVALEFDKYVKKDTLNKFIGLTSHHFYSTLLTELYSFIIEVSNSAQTHATRILRLYQNYDTIKILSKKARAIGRAGLGSIGDVLRNSFNAKAFLNKVKYIGFDMATEMMPRLELASALGDEIVTDAYETFSKHMKTLSSELFFSARDYFVKHLRAYSLGMKIVPREDVEAINDHLNFLKSKGLEQKVKKEKTKTSAGHTLRRGEEGEEDEWTWGGVAENKKPRKKQIIKIKIKDER